MQKMNPESDINPGEFPAGTMPGIAVQIPQEAPKTLADLDLPSKKNRPPKSTRLLIYYNFVPTVPFSITSPTDFDYQASDFKPDLLEGRIEQHHLDAMLPKIRNCPHYKLMVPEVFGRFRNGAGILAINYLIMSITMFYCHHNPYISSTIENMIFILFLIVLSVGANMCFKGYDQLVIRKKLRTKEINRVIEAENDYYQTRAGTIDGPSCKS